MDNFENPHNEIFLKTLLLHHFVVEGGGVIYNSLSSKYLPCCMHAGFESFSRYPESRVGKVLVKSH